MISKTGEQVGAEERSSLDVDVALIVAYIRLQGSSNANYTQSKSHLNLV
jgi:hypothetical protein